jgi:hypothetical protein
MNNIIKTTIILSIIVLSLKTQAQQLVSASGGHYSDAQLNVSWSVGETVIETFTDDNYILTQGFQQPGLVLVGIESFSDQFEALHVYPNPTSDYVNINLNEDYDNLSYRVLNSEGKVIQNKQIENKTFQISFTEQNQGLYLIHLMDGTKTMKIFRIIKN